MVSRRAQVVVVLVGVGAAVTCLALTRQLHLLAICADPAENQLWRAVAREELQELLPPAALLRQVLAIEDPAARGAFHAVLASTGDPAHLEAVLSYVRGLDEYPVGFSFDGFLRSLRSFGPEREAAALRDLLQDPGQAGWLVPDLWEGLLAVDDTAADELATVVESALDDYDELKPQLARAARTLEEHGRGSGAEGPEHRDAVALRQRGAAAARRIGRLLEVLVESTDSPAADLCLLRGLSTFDEDLAGRCARRLQERQSGSELVETLMGYVARKPRFSAAEVELYEDLMVARGAAGARALVAVLARLLAAAGGDPERVFWVQKRMAFRVLARVGTPEALPVLERYLEDGTSYASVERAGDRRTEVEVRHADQCRLAIEAILAREPR
jgi:hypothetical protein